MLKKLKQESTWRGLIALASVLGVVLNPSQAKEIVAAAVTLIGLINIIKKD